MSLRKQIRNLAQKAGYDIVRVGDQNSNGLPPDLSEEDKKIIAAVQPYTMTSVERIAAVIDAVKHITRLRVPGAVVECGVWRGGSTMAALLALSVNSVRDREVFLYDTFEGMSEPTAKDKSWDGLAASKQLAEAEKGKGIWCFASLEDVQRNVFSTGYPQKQIHFVRGKVEETIPKTLPTSIALLRLDTDWYESTRHELEHLFPLLDRRGILIVDDYGYWAGAREAVDEYFARRPEAYYFHRIDDTGRTILRMPD